MRFSSGWPSVHMASDVIWPLMSIMQDCVFRCLNSSTLIVCMYSLIMLIVVINFYY